MPGPSKKLRILLVEDDIVRQRTITAWLPADVHLVWCQNGEAALGVVARVARDELAAIMLDNDLDKRQYVETEKRKTGADVARYLVERIGRDTPVLVHSMSVDREQIMNLLRAGGFPVTQLPYADLTREKLVAWIADVRADRED